MSPWNEAIWLKMILFPIFLCHLFVVHDLWLDTFLTGWCRDWKHCTVKETFLVLHTDLLVVVGPGAVKLNSVSRIRTFAGLKGGPRIVCISSGLWHDGGCKPARRRRERSQTMRWRLHYQGGSLYCPKWRSWLSNYNVLKLRSVSSKICFPQTHSPKYEIAHRVHFVHIVRKGLLKRACLISAFVSLWTQRTQQWCSCPDADTGHDQETKEQTHKPHSPSSQSSRDARVQLKIRVC